MPKVSAAHLEARRRGILAAAQRCISRKGARATTMRDICRAANLSPGGVYRYFESKESILAALAEQRRDQVRRFVDRLVEAAAERPAMIERLAELVALLDESAAQDGLRLDAHLWSEALTDGQLRRLLTDSHAEIFAAIADRWPPASSSAGPATARLALAILQGLALQKALEPDLDLRALSDELRRFLAR